MTVFPGMDDVLIALSLLAVEPRLKGVLIAGPPGTGKTTLARAARALFPPEAPFVNVPLGCTIDRLVGGVDLEKSRNCGKVIDQPGLMAEAHGGVIYVDEINLLPPEIINALMEGLMSGQIRLEREGLSKVYPTRFVLIGTYNPAESELAMSVQDRVAFRVYTQTLSHLSWRVFLSAHRDTDKRIPEEVVERIRRARQVIPFVEMHPDQCTKLCQMASNSGVEGNRAELFAYYCARANAALHYRVPVTEQDLSLAMRLIFLSRMGALPLPGEDNLETNTKSQKSNRKQKAPDKAQNEPREQSGEKEEQRQRKSNSENQNNEGLGKEHKGHARSESLEMPVEEGGAMDLPKVKGLRRTGRRIGKHLSGINYRRGRFIRAVPGDIRKGKIDMLATIKQGVQRRKFTARNGNRYLKLSKEDFRIKQFRQQSGLLFIFAVDGSGSMAINNYGAAKGVAMQLLERAYVYRDQVAMIFFRRNRADLLLEPGHSLAKAHQVLRKIPAGGRTPIAQALLKCQHLAERANYTKKVAGVVLILFTDGRANQPLRSLEDGTDCEVAAMRELMPLCKHLRRELCGAIVVDTKHYARSAQNGERIAHWLGAEYMHLPRSTAQVIHTKIQSEISHLR